VRFAFGAGGTGGHIVPALALAERLKEKGHQCIFIGNRLSMEERMAQKAGYPFYSIKVQKLYRGLKPANLLFPLYLGLSIVQSRKLLKELDIAGVITTGGFVAGPVALAAISKKIPCFLHESNSYPGITTKYLARHLHRLYISFEESRSHLVRGRIKNFGIPILKQSTKKEPDRAEFGLSKDKAVLLITGGSQGSLAINSVVSSIVSVLLEQGWQILWQTGKTTFRQFETAHKDKAGIQIFDFTTDLPQMMRCADLAITRAGAMTIAELEAAALPAILVPLPTAAENHQYHNAKAQKKKGVAELIIQSELSAQNLLSTIKSMDRASLRKNLLALPPNTAAEQICEDILSFYKEK
jgi:UDP-N-acetylglucosamine--N-acetylmuramyl-(pentapeptide) pyrophosphoryl-undecaprenol N-acetylglucosamine transferase